uniref:Penicillin G acylase n=1 Tax=Kluyvera cryocrescens TaxID=580 RepID=UPI001747DC40|nr:Chain A, Penicillin G acylase [Kluyvera cryocrescens]
SNMWVIGKNKAQDAKAIMVNGPQFGWYVPAYTYGIGLHGAGYDVTGNTPFAYPGIVFGHNGTISWGSTAGGGDDVDIFAEKLSAEKPGYYQHNGEWVKMLSRKETIAVKDGQPETFTVWRTLHGNVIWTDTATQTAYAKARAWDGKEVASLLAWTHQMKAKNWPEWTQQAAKQALTINWYYADVNGNIGYVHTGAYPDRQPGHDPRLPVPGTGKWDWKGLLSFDLNPKVYNPQSGYIANWNNSPQKDYPASDSFPFLWGGADRVTEIDTILDKQPRFTADQAWDVIRQTSRRDLNLRLFLPALKDATANLAENDPRRQLVDKLASWDGENLVNDDGKTYQQPGSAILDAWLTSMLKRTVVAAVPAPFGKWYSASGYETTPDGPTGSLNISVGAKILYEALQGDKSPIPQAVDLFGGKPQQEVILAALDDAWQTLSKRYGNDVDSWKTPAMALTWRANNFFGVPQAAAKEARPQAEYQNRGTENDMIVFSPTSGNRPVLAWDVVAPGQSGFIAPDGKKDKHYDDQLKMYESFGRKSLWLTPQDVDEHQESQEVLQVQLDQGEVKIVRDEYGMPHIYADDTYRLFYGYGYVVAQDRLFQMEMARRSTQGTVSEVLGKAFVSFDKDIRQNYWPDSIRAQIASLSAEDKSILQGYADGMNAWIDKVNASPDKLLPQQFSTFGFKPKHWEPFDVAMIFVGTMANRWSDSTSEIDNLALLTALKDKYGKQQGMAVFNQLKWLVNPSAPTTIAARESAYPLKFDLQNTQTAHHHHHH